MNVTRFMKLFDIIFVMENLFAKRLKELRVENNLSQNDMAKEFNVRGQTISAWENGLQETNFDTLIKLALYFDVSVDYLLGKES